ncbi:hypothetical protein BDF22DRAFT_683648 [Syncephalis plumigaleata]|nr:hypothetical protein BDF22DRAFT_683648 [Syncephalis plumigaleata]
MGPTTQTVYASPPEDNQPTPKLSDVNAPSSQSQSLASKLLAVIELNNLAAIAVWVGASLVPYHFVAVRVWSWCAQFPDDKLFLYGSAILIITVIAFYLGLLTLIDLGYGPRAWQHYRIQPNKKSQVTWYYKILPVAGFNLLVLSPLALYATYYIVAHVQQRQITTEALPSLGRMLVDILVSSVALETSYYYGHRSAHHPRLYKYCHKLHHDFTAPIPLAAFHMHPVDYLLTNVLPLLLGPMLFKLHIMTVWLWMSMALVLHIHLHCGLELPYLPTPMDHDYHHQVFNANYGVFGFYDAFHNTRGKYNNYRSNWLAKLTASSKQE